MQHINYSIAFFLFFISASLNAQWVQTPGPDGGSPSIISIGDTLFAGTDNGLFKSTDDGEHWSQLAFSRLETNIRPAAGKILFARILPHTKNYLFRSLD